MPPPPPTKGLKKRHNATLSRTAFKLFPADQNILSNSDRTHRLPSLFSTNSRKFQLFQIGSECTNHEIQDCGHTAYFTTPWWSQSMCYLIAVSNIVSECVVMHAKASLFPNDLCSSKSFQIPSEVTIYRLLFLKILCSSKSFQIPSKCTI